MDSTGIAFAVLGSLLGIIGIFLLYSTVQNSLASQRWFSNPSPLGQRVDLPTTSLYTTVKGTGGPTVIFEPGVGLTSPIWWVCQATTVSYDRAGYGWSYAGVLPRTVAQAVAELRELLERLALKPPYVLVGHSFGGLMMAYFAKKYPQEVSGVILLDAVPFDNARFEKELSPAAFKYGVDKTRMLKSYRIFSKLGIFRRFNLASKLQIPEQLKQPLLENYCQDKAIRASISEMANLEESIKQTREISGVLAIPLYVVSHSRKVHMDFYAQFGEYTLPMVEAQHIEDLWEETYREYLTLSPRSRWFVAEKSGHSIPLDEPGFVVALIQRILQESAG
jgi:pimeloyl-ACP methyl ester carboxylesterase